MNKTKTVYTFIIVLSYVCCTCIRMTYVLVSHGVSKMVLLYLNNVKLMCLIFICLKITVGILCEWQIFMREITILIKLCS